MDIKTVFPTLHHLQLLQRRIEHEMPHKVMSSAGIPSVDAYSDAIERWLRKANDIKQQAGIEPALIATDFLDEIEEIGKIRLGSGVSTQQAHYAAIETAFRDKFYELLVRGSSLCNARYAKLLFRLRHPSVILPSARYGISLMLW